MYIDVTMNIKITASYPKALVRELVELAYKYVFHNKLLVPPDDFQIWVKNSQYPYAGRIYYSGKIVVRIGKPNHFPFIVKYPRLKTAPVYTFRDWMEAIFGVTVHEFWHWYQYNSKSPRSEIECEQRVVSALATLREIRPAIEAKMQGILEKQQVKIASKSAREAVKENPAYQLGQVQVKIAKYVRKIRLFQNRLKKLHRRMKFLQKKVQGV